MGERTGRGQDRTQEDSTQEIEKEEYADPENKYIQIKKPKLLRQATSPIWRGACPSSLGWWMPKGMLDWPMCS